MAIVSYRGTQHRTGHLFHPPNSDLHGSATWRTLGHHLLPNIAPVLIVIYRINIGAVVISEASLSFLGFGLPVRAAGAELHAHGPPLGRPPCAGVRFAFNRRVTCRRVRAQSSSPTTRRAP